MARSEMDLGRVVKGIDFGDPRSRAGYRALVDLERRLPHYRSLGTIRPESSMLHGAGGQEARVTEENR